ncbi:hypothetical protein ACFL27_10570 [candidate division CSSED10-310 bacterium]|uniref:Uncharacterized protein n=1 Tax=candidate division CSSED10-310 bacterium TaxID=2855610 RepID=A0ABV6YWN7_UNCC1
MMQKIKLNVIISFFRLKPGIKKLDQGNYKEIMNVFKKNYHEISERTKKESGIMAFHRMFLIIGLALYKALYNRIQDKEELIDKIHDILWQERMAKNIRFIAFFIRRCKDQSAKYQRSALFETGSYDVVNREDMTELLIEQKFQQLVYSDDTPII